MVYCLSRGRKGHAGVLIKSVPHNSCGAGVAHQGAAGVVAALLEKLQLGFNRSLVWRPGVCSLMWRPGVSRSTCMGLPGLSKAVLMQGAVLGGTAPAGWL